MGYIPPPAPREQRIVPSVWDCEYCGTYVPMGLVSRCPSCGAPFRRRVRDEPGTGEPGEIFGTGVLKPEFPKNRIIRE